MCHGWFSVDGLPVLSDGLRRFTYESLFHLCVYLPLFSMFQSSAASAWGGQADWSLLSEKPYVLHRKFHEWRFDFQRNVDTRGPEMHDGHGDSALRRSAMHYEATTPMLFRKIMKATGAHSMPEAFFDMVYQPLHYATVILA